MFFRLLSPTIRSPSVNPFATKEGGCFTPCRSCPATHEELASPVVLLHGPSEVDTWTAGVNIGGMIVTNIYRLTSTNKNLMKLVLWCYQLTSLRVTAAVPNVSWWHQFWKQWWGHNVKILGFAVMYCAVAPSMISIMKNWWRIWRWDWQTRMSSLCRTGASDSV